MKKLIKRHIYKITLFVIFHFFISCEHNTSYEEANVLYQIEENYNGKQFTDCDEFLQVSESLAEEILLCIDEGIQGEMDKVDELQQFFNEKQSFLMFMSREHDRLERSCPERLRRFENEYNQLLEEKMLILKKKLENNNQTIENPVSK